MTTVLACGKKNRWTHPILVKFTVWSDNKLMRVAEFWFSHSRSHKSPPEPRFILWPTGGKSLHLTCKVITTSSTSTRFNIKIVITRSLFPTTFSFTTNKSFQWLSYLTIAGNTRKTSKMSHRLSWSWHLLQAASMTATTYASTGRNCAILTSDKQVGQSMWQHHKQSSDKTGFTDGGHSS